MLDEDLRTLTNKDNIIDQLILSIINDAGLSKENNTFFIQAEQCTQKIPVNIAFNIAYNWREITKTFMFTSIRGLGSLAEKIGSDDEPNTQLLSVLQTGFQIISDDLGNNHTLFPDSKLGHKSIHFKWWEDSILTPLKIHMDIQEAKLTHETIFLLRKMKEISTNYLGVAVQLRVVEAIAQNICLAFLAIFSNIEHHGKRIFSSKKDLAWIYSHIEAENIHHHQVCDKESGMAMIVRTIEEQRALLMLTKDYAYSWANALNSMATFLKGIVNSPSKLP